MINLLASLIDRKDTDLPATQDLGFQLEVHISANDEKEHDILDDCVLKAQGTVHDKSKDVLIALCQELER